MQGTAESQQDWLNDPAGAVARFKQRYGGFLICLHSTGTPHVRYRNAILRDVLDYAERHLGDTLRNQGGLLNPPPVPSQPVGGEHAAAPDALSLASSPETMKNVPLGPG